MPEPSIDMLSKSLYSTELDNVLMLVCIAVFGVYLFWLSVNRKFDSFSSKKEALRSFGRTPSKSSRRPSNAGGGDPRRRTPSISHKDSRDVETSGIMSPVRARRNSADIKKSSLECRKQSSFEGRLTAESLGDHMRRTAGPNVVGGNEFLTTFGNMPRSAFLCVVVFVLTVLVGPLGVGGIVCVSNR